MRARGIECYTCRGSGQAEVALDNGFSFKKEQDPRYSLDTAWVTCRDCKGAGIIGWIADEFDDVELEE